MKAESTTQASSQSVSRGSPNGFSEPRAALSERDAAQRFAGLIDGKGAPAAKDGKSKQGAMQAVGGKEDPKLHLRRQPDKQALGELEGGAEQAIAAAGQHPTFSTDPQSPDQDDAGAVQPFSSRETVANAAPASATSAAADPADAASFAQALDRVHADQRASSETQLTLPDGRWAAQAARIATAPDGAGVSLSLDLNQGEQHDQAATRELRRRLEARGIRVASIETR